MKNIKVEMNKKSFISFRGNQYSIYFRKLFPRAAKSNEKRQKRDEIFIGGERLVMAFHVEKFLNQL